MTEHTHTTSRRRPPAAAPTNVIPFRRKVPVAPVRASDEAKRAEMLRLIREIAATLDANGRAGA